jgi:hypothetical protein
VETIILLGDLPIYWFLRFHNNQYAKLAQFCTTESTYGKPHEIKINNKHNQVIALCHPRKVDWLKNSNSTWGILHDEWVKYLLFIFSIAITQKDSQKISTA